MTLFTKAKLKTSDGKQTLTNIAWLTFLIHESYPLQTDGPTDPYHKKASLSENKLLKIQKCPRTLPFNGFQRKIIKIK